MTSIYRSTVLWAGLLAAATAPAFSQVISVIAEQPQSTVSIVSGGSLNMAADAIGLPVTAKLTFSYHPSSATSAVSVFAFDRTGSNDFSISPVAIPLSLGQGTGTNFTAVVTYLPSSGARTTGQLTMRYQEDASSPVTFTINLVGTASDLIFSYTLANGNATPVANGGIVPFPLTPLNTTSTALFTLTNRGTATATVGAITGLGGVFQIAGLSVPPFSIDPSQALRFSINFTPLVRDPQAGSLFIDYAQKTYAFNVQGAGAGPSFVYTLAQGDAATALAPNQTIPFPDTNVGSKVNVTVQVQNNGNADGIISNISVLGASFQLNDLPFLPLTLPVGNAVAFTVTFVPSQSGTLTGRLRVGTDTFNITGNGLGPALTYSYTIGGATTVLLSPASDSGTPVPPVLFTSVQVGRDMMATFTVANNGNVAANIGSIFLGTTTEFKLSALPSLPATLNPGASVTFNIDFAPDKAAVLQSTLSVGTQSFNITGSGLAPDPLPPIQLNGPSGAGQPFQQPSYTLSLGAPYSVNLAGTLTLAFNSAVFTNDATIQFATGGRTVAFSIPAGSTQAVFSNNATQIAIQTGSVAGTITLTPSIGMASGINLTPDSVPTVNITIPQTPPQITSLQIGTRTPTSFTLLITGYATGRSVSRIDVNVTAAAGESIPSGLVSFNVDSAFVAWYQNAQSQQFGSVFTASVPISMGGTSVAANLIDAIQSASVTITNSLGSSSPVAVSFH